MQPINPNSIADVPVQNQVLPAGGPKAVPVNLDFSNTANGNSSWSLSLQQPQALARFSNLQTLWIDNTRNTQVLTVTVGQATLGQQIKVKAGTQGYYTVLSPNPIELSFSVDNKNGTDAATVILINVPLPSSQWSII